MIDLENAIETILANVTPLDSEDIALDNMVGRVLAQDIVANIDVSSFRNSAMDGFAIQSESLVNCSPDSPVTLTVAGVTYAGDSNSPKSATSDNHALKIMTGAPVPESYDAVIKVEDTSFTESSVTFRAPTKHGANIRPPGEDFKKGEKLFKSGHQLKPLEIGVLASTGLSHVSVTRQPQVSVFTTGDELIEPGGEIAFGQIYNSNRYTIAALIKPFCASIKHAPPLADNQTALRVALNSDSEIIITSGGVSAGDKDLIPAVAAELGWKQLFHKISMKPGKPVFFARRKNQLLFGLPGNPLSTAVSCATLVIPALKKMSGIPNHIPQPTPAILRSKSRSGKRVLLWPGKINWEAGKLYAEYSPKKSSASLTAILASDGLIIERQTPSNSNSGADINDTPTVEVLFWDDLLR